MMQPVDFTTLTALVRELTPDWVPSRVENVYQRDRYTIALGLRTLSQRGWIGISWHPQAARIGVTTSPPRTPDTFTFSQQLRSILGGLVMVEIAFVAPWERTIDLRFAKRPGDEAIYHLYVEIMGNYSNVILTDANNLVIATAHQVNAQQSSVRTIQTGQPYERPPAQTDPMPNPDETIDRWRDRISLIPAKLNQRLVRSYRGLSTALVNNLAIAAGLNPTQTTDNLSDDDWQKLFEIWQTWLEIVNNRAENKFSPCLTQSGYSIINWQDRSNDLHQISPLIDRYYSEILDREQLRQIGHQLIQKIGAVLSKLRVKANTFTSKLTESSGAEIYKAQADLLMANLHQWQPGLKVIMLDDFETGAPVKIPLQVDKNAIQNAQSLYKRHQKLKRAKLAVVPLLAEVQAEIDYLEQVESSIVLLQERDPNDRLSMAETVQTLIEIKQELIATGYITTPERNSKIEPATTPPHKSISPSGFELLIGRNNRQNDTITFKLATDYDLWFHTQQIAGSHGLLRIPPGQSAELADLQFAANAVAYYSRARQSQAVPVVYTAPKHVYKPKGAKPGMVIYKHEQIVWGYPQQLNP
jgi:predicted ribosome quality control (RQC) complex YloA/Tae2 family protein